jgi:hypothetical protein
MSAFPKYPAIALFLAAFAHTAGAALTRPKQPKTAQPGSTAVAQAKEEPGKIPAPQAVVKTGSAAPVPSTATTAPEKAAPVKAGARSETGSDAQAQTASPAATAQPAGSREEEATKSPAAQAGAAPAAANNCEEVKTQIEAKIKAKGVKSFTLDIVDADAVKDAKVVGSCGGGQSRIIYTRG